MSVGNYEVAKRVQDYTLLYISGLYNMNMLYELIIEMVLLLFYK